MSRQQIQEQAGGSRFSVPGAETGSAVTGRTGASIASARRIEAERVDHTVWVQSAPVTLRVERHRARIGSTLVAGSIKRCRPPMITDNDMKSAQDHVVATLPVPTAWFRAP